MSRYDWLEQLHRAHYDTLVRLAKHRLRQHGAAESEAEDVVQQVFLLAAEKDISGHDVPLRWLMRAVENLCMNRGVRAMRAEQKVKRVIQQRMDNSAVRSVYAVDTQESLAEHRETLIMLEQLLTPAEWELMRKYCLEDVSIDELAAQNHLSPVTLRVKMHRLRKKLKKEFYGM